LVGVHLNTYAYFFHRFREIIELEAEYKAIFGVEIDVDERYCGGQHKSKLERGAAGKILHFGLLKRRGKVYTKVIPDDVDNDC
jgi:transposase